MGSNVVSEDLVLPFLFSRLPEEEIARQLGAGSVIVLSIRRLYTEEPERSFNSLHLDAETGKYSGRTKSPGPEQWRIGAELRGRVVTHVENGRNRPTQRTCRP